jgi:hypothetical protein
MIVSFHEMQGFNNSEFQTILSATLFVIVVSASQLCWNFETVYRVVVPGPARLAESIPWNRLLGFLKVLKYRL